MLDPMSEESRNYEPTVSKPLVYHLYGDINIPESLVLTERDYFDFVIKSNKDERDSIATVIRRYLALSSLLLIGYSLDDIDFHAIFQGALSLFESRHRRKESIAVLSPPVGSVADKQIIVYMDNYVRNLLKVHAYWGSPTSFCYQLKKRLQKNVPSPAEAIKTQEPNHDNQSHGAPIRRFFDTSENKMENPK